MKSICITGSDQTTLEVFGGIFQSSGAKEASPALRGEEVTINHWHEKALATVDPDESQPMILGRVWEQIAGDIFFANHLAPLWYWAEAASIRCLDYWRNFDPHTYFLLIYTSPQEEILNALSASNFTLDSVDEILENWKARTTKIVNFREENPSRTAILDRCQRNSVTLQELSSAWGLNINIHAASEPSQTWSPLERHIALGFISQRHDIIALQNKIDSLLFSDDRHSLRNYTLDETKILEYFKGKHNHRTDERLSLIAGVPALRQNEIQDENGLLLSQLHHTQELLEGHILKNIALNRKSTLDTKRIKNLLQRTSRKLEYSSIDVRTCSTTVDQSVTLWRLTDVYLSEQHIPLISFKIKFNNGAAELYILRDSNNSDEKPWIEWPSSLANTDELPCAPIKGSATLGANAILTKMNARDWRNLKSLVKYLANDIDAIRKNASHDAIDWETLRIGLSNLSSTLENWPLAFRFSAIELRSTKTFEHYKGIQIRLNGLSLGDHWWDSLTYTLASVDHSRQMFGMNPRLEFDESNSGTIENWFPETSDHRGTRLELRFAQPNALDLKVWHSLSQRDRVLIAGIIGSLPMQFEAIKSKHDLDTTNWENWSSIAGFLKKTLNENNRSPRKLEKIT